MAEICYLLITGLPQGILQIWFVSPNLNPPTQQQESQGDEPWLSCEFVNWFGLVDYILINLLQGLATLRAIFLNSPL